MKIISIFANGLLLTDITLEKIKYKHVFIFRGKTCIGILDFNKCKLKYNHTSDIDNTKFYEVI